MQGYGLPTALRSRHKGHDLHTQAILHLVLGIHLHELSTGPLTRYSVVKSAQHKALLLPMPINENHDMPRPAGITPVALKSGLKKLNTRIKATDLCTPRRMPN